MKIAYLSGPANGPSIYKEWQSGTQEYFGTDYMRQFLQLTTDLGAEGYVVTWHGDVAYKVSCGALLFDNRPLKIRFHYYFAQLWWHLRLLPVLMNFHPHLLILTGNQNFWWVLSPLRLFGTRFLPSFHCTLWPKLGRTKAPRRFLLQLERLLVFSHCPIVVATSHDIGRQVERLSDAEVIYHLPTWEREQFASIPPPQSREPFRVFFAGRMEGNKGIWDVLAMAHQLPDVKFDICGTGSELERARRSAPENIMFHGFCGRDAMQRIVSSSDVCIVPTRREFEAGFEMTCAEAILAGRPLITSSVCPALEYVAAASVEVEPDDVQSYINAIRRLRDDPALYQSKQNASAAVAEQFYDRSNSWLIAMKKAIARLIAKEG